jgi:transcriptional regulator with XRE-family HTH domain
MSKLNCDLIKIKREEMGLTVDQVAEKLNLTPERLTQLENGDEPVLDEITALMKFYGVTEEELLIEEEEEEPEEEEEEEAV